MNLYHNHAHEVAPAPRSVREILDGPVLPYVGHFVLRGTYQPGTVRCTADNPIVLHSYEDPNDYGFVLGGLTVNCFADVRVNAYVVGSGPSTLTVQTGWHLYWPGYYEGVQDMTHAEFVELMRGTFETILIRGNIMGHDLETGAPQYSSGLEGREVVLFVGPPASLSSEAWLVIDTWDVQRLDDGTVMAVHPERDVWRDIRPDDYQTHRSTLEMTLTAFTSALTTAHQARVAENSGRIGAATNLPMLTTDANQLRQAMTDAGAYVAGTPTPAQPPPP